MKKLLIDTGLIIIKLLLVLKNIFAKILRLIAKFFRFFLKLLFYKPLIRIYYWIFRLKNNKAIPSSPHKLLAENSAVLLVVFLFLLLVFFNVIEPNPANALENNIPHTIIAHLVTRGFNNSGEGDLIEENADISAILASNKENHLDNSYSLNKEDGLNVNKNTENIDKLLLTKNQDAIIKPKTITTDLSLANDNGIRTRTIEYTIVSGDTISSIAKKFSISVNTVLWANNLRSSSLISPGKKLTILPYSGILYTVRSGDSLAKIARTYGVSEKIIIKYNKIGKVLRIGEKLMIPGAKKIIIRTTRRRSKSSFSSLSSLGSTLSLKGLERLLQIERAKNRKNRYRNEYHRYTGLSVIRDFIKYPNARSTANKMLWPTVGHHITQYFSWHHPGIDIANKIGTPLYAADSGTVIFAGVSRGYGNNVVIDHGNGRKTRYAHASKLFVRVGQHVKRGQTIAAMGSSGWSTGPHVHFEVLINNQRRNPLNYVK